MSIMSNWWVIVIVVAVIIALGLALVKFFEQPRSQQINDVKEWLLFAVVEAEKKFGEKTGQIKLRWTYDLFVSKFPWIAKFLSFDTFSLMVDESLEKMIVLLENKKVKEYVTYD